MVSIRSLAAPPAPALAGRAAKPAAPRGGKLLYLALADSLQELVDAGTLRPGHRLPSVRRLSRQRDVSISTVLQAYAVLENRGTIEARPQSGYYVKPRPLCLCPEPRMARPMAKPVYVSTDDIVARTWELALHPHVVPLGAACPDPSLFPTKKLGRILASVCRDDPALLGRYAMSWAYEPLSREIARRALQDGAAFSHEEIVVTAGCTEALNLCLRAVTQPGDTVALETPAYFGFLQIIQSLNLRALEIPTDPREGICLEALEDALSQHEVKACLVMPAFHNPLGSSMPDAKKEKLVALCAARGVPLIEDDLYGDLHFEERRPKPLKAFDRTGDVMLCSSFGKTLAPGFRVGWTAPGRHLERVRRLKFTNTLGTPVVLQKALTEFLRNGGYDHHLRSIRRAYQNQMHLFGQAVLRHFPEGTRLSRPRGGFILWLELPTRVDTLALHGQALERGIATAPGPLFSVKDRYRHCLRLNCGLPWSETIADALATLGSLARASA